MARRLAVGGLLTMGMASTLGCASLPSAGPTACRDAFSAARCRAIAKTAAGYAQVERAQVASVEILPEPPPQVVDGRTIYQSYGGATPIRVRLTLVDGTTRETAICAGIPDGPACTDDPHLRAASVTQGGYYDVPCSGDPPAGCATPVPSIDPAVAASARPLSVADLSIPIDHIGEYDVVVGTATLPNGILTDASFGFADDWPDGVSIIDSAVNLEVRSQADGRTIRNIYEHGRVDGPETVEAVMVFAVDEFSPGATLEIMDVVVR